MLRQSRSRVTGTIGEFIEALAANRSQGTRDEKVARAIAVMYRNGVLTLDQVSGLSREYGVIVDLGEEGK